MSKKVAYVTGGMGGIGTAICQRLAKDGFTVVAGCGPTRDFTKWIDEQKALGYTFYASVGNVGDWDSTVEAFAKVKAEHGPVSVLVNNAGITRDGQFRKMSKADWDAVISTNLNSMFNVTKQVIEDMIEGGYGRIINISSVNGQKGQFGQVNYSTAKAGGRQGRDGQHRQPGLHRHRHGQGHPPRGARENRCRRTRQTPRPAGRNCIHHFVDCIKRRRLCDGR